MIFFNRFQWLKLLLFTVTFLHFDFVYVRCWYTGRCLSYGLLIKISTFWSFIILLINWKILFFYANSCLLTLWNVWLFLILMFNQTSILTNWWFSFWPFNYRLWFVLLEISIIVRFFKHFTVLLFLNFICLFYIFHYIFKCKIIFQIFRILFFTFYYHSKVIILIVMLR